MYIYILYILCIIMICVSATALKETLSMIEEAAGTRMYENKKAVALKTLEKKQYKAGNTLQAGIFSSGLSGKVCRKSKIFD